VVGKNNFVPLLIQLYWGSVISYSFEFHFVIYQRHFSGTWKNFSEGVDQKSGWSNKIEQHLEKFDFEFFRWISNWKFFSYYILYHG